MSAMIRAESERILTMGIVVVFAAVVVLFSAMSSHQAVGRYEVWNETGMIVTGVDNIRHCRESGEGWKIEDMLIALRDSGNAGVYENELNAEMLAALNYEGKRTEELSDGEITDFYMRRLSVIQENLDNSSRITYTESDKNAMLEKAGELSSLTLDYAEGWKVITRDSGTFIPIVLLMISVILVPLFASDSQTKMKELCISTRNGKQQLDNARMIAAFSVGTAFYVLGILLYFIIKMLPFGLAGAHAYIQSNTSTFFSVHHITYIQQFMLNIMFGFVALMLMISVTVCVSILAEGILAGNVIIIFFWILLLIMEQMAQFPVNHWFANFMPLRLPNTLNYLVGMEVYHLGGIGIASIIWCPLVGLMVTLAIVLLSAMYLHIKRKEKYE